MHSFPVLIASRGTSNKRDHCDEVRERYNGASTTHLELVFLQVAWAAAIKRNLELVLI
jgi:hypothetical protein